MTEWEKFERMVSLKSETVELGLAQDLYKKFDSLKSSVVDAEKTARAAANSVDQAASKINSIIKDLKVLDNSFEELIKKANDLGVEVKDASIYKRQVSAYINEAEELSKTLDKSSDMIFGILQ